jgi:hypothetical protein
LKKLRGTPKSDFHCIDQTKKPLIFISHKKGKSPTDFQQWSGLTEEEIANNPLVQEFAIRAKAEYGTKMPSSESFAAELPNNNVSNNLKMQSVFGVKSLSKQWGINCVDVLIQGDPGLIEVSKGLFKFTATRAYSLLWRNSNRRF